MDHVEWTVDQRDFLRSKEQHSLDPLQGNRASSDDPQLEHLRAQVESLKSTLRQTNRAERTAKREYAAATSRAAKGSVGGGTTAWESKNRMEDHALSLASSMCDFVVRTYSALEAMRDEMRVTISNYRRHGPGAYPTDEALGHIFAQSTVAVDEVRKGLSEVMPLFSSTVRHQEPLTILRDMRSAIDRESERPLECPAAEYVERWRLRAAERLVDTAPAPSSQPRPYAKSTIADKTTLAFELLASPRTVLPRPPPRERESRRSGRKGPSVHQSVNTRSELHQKHGVAGTNPAPLDLEVIHHSATRRMTASASPRSASARRH